MKQEITEEVPSDSPLDVTVPKQIAESAAINREGEVQIYDVPVVRKKWKTKKYEGGNMGLIEEIRSAKSVDEVNSLLKKGEEYKSVSEKTRRKWNTVAQKVSKQLSAVKPAPKKKVAKKKAVKK